MRAARALPLALAAVLLLAACQSGPAPADLEPQVVDLRPVGVEDPAEVEEGGAAGDESCDPTASLRPRGPLPAPGQMPGGSTMATIQQRGTLIAGVDQNANLFSYRNPITGELEGFDIDLAREIAAAITGDPDRIQYRILTAAERIPALQAGEVDIVARAFTVTCERWQEVSFSTVYFDAGQRLLVQRDPETGKPEYQSMEELAGEKVCATRGSTAIRTVANHPAEPVPVTVAVGADCQVMLQQGQVEAVVSDDVLLAGMAVQDPHSAVVGEQFTAEPYGVGVATDHPDLVRFVNGVLERIRRDGTWERMYQQWFGDSLGSRTPQPPPARYRD